MKKEDATLISQLLQTMEEATSQLEIAQKEKNMGNFNKMKREILNLQKKIDQLLR